MKKELIVHKNPKSPNSEIFRTLRTNIQFMNTNKKLKTLLITSTFPGEGKSWITANLAVTFAQAGKKVVLIDADMRKGRQYSIFGAAPKPGLSNYLAEAEIDEDGKISKNIGEYIQETEVENLYIIAAGNVPPNPSELLVSPQMIRLLDDLKELCDLIIIDGTPCELVADSIILSRLVDSSVIVTSHKTTKKDALERVIKNIQNVGGKLAGVVINRVPTSKGYGSRYYYYGSNKSNSEKNNKFRDTNINFKKKPTKKQTDKLEKDIAKLHEEINNKPEEPENENIPNEESKKDTKKEEVKEEKVTNSSPNIADKTNEIIKQINDYINEEKKNLK